MTTVPSPNVSTQIVPQANMSESHTPNYWRSPTSMGA